MFLLLTLSIRIIKSIFFYFNPELSNIFIQFGLSACILIGPFLYLYLQSQLFFEKSSWHIQIFPYLIGITVIGYFYPYTEHREIWSRWVVKSIYLQWFVYLVISYKFISPILGPAVRQKNLNLWLISIYFGVAFIWLSYCVAAYTSYIVGALSFTFVLYLIILLLIFKYAKSANFFEEKERYKNKKLDLNISKEIAVRIGEIKTKELYLNPNLTLDDTAKVLQIPKHQLSQYLNETLGLSFNQFVNEYRIKKAKELLKTKTNYSIEGIGQESGFNSKSTFFTIFKKTTGKTQLEFQKSSSN